MDTLKQYPATDFFFSARHPNNHIPPTLQTNQLRRLKRTHTWCPPCPALQCGGRDAKNTRRSRVVKLYPYLRGNRPFILPESLSIWEWENGKITPWWREPLKSWGEAKSSDNVQVFISSMAFVALFIPGSACWSGRVFFEQFSTVQSRFFPL